MFRATSRVAGAAAAVGAAILISACGSAVSTSSASRSRPPQAEINDVVRFAACMRGHGVAGFPDPTSSPRAFKDALSSQAPAIRSAQRACEHLLPGGGPPSQSDARSAAQKAAMLAFARCMRAHGFPRFPDPSSSGDLSHEMLAAAGISLHQPAVVPAADACTGVTHGQITKADVARFVAGQ